MKTYVGLEVQFHASSILAQDGGKWSASHPRERAPGIQWTGSWVCLRTSLDKVVKRKNPCHCQKSTLGHPAYSSVPILTELIWPVAWHSIKTH